MAERVFSDPGERAALEAITHPRIAAASAAEFARLAGAGHPVAIYEAALLVENRIHERLAGLIVVSAPEALQIERLAARDQIGEAAARARLAAQRPLADKIAVATWVVDNSGTVEQTRAQVESIWREIHKGAAET
jgi:dephospho-CoA kinase